MLPFNLVTEKSRRSRRAQASEAPQRHSRLGLLAQMRSAQLRNSEAALKDSLKEEAAGKGRRFSSGREAIRWLES